MICSRTGIGLGILPSGEERGKNGSCGEAVAFQHLPLTLALLSGINTPAAYSSLPPDLTKIRAVSERYPGD